MNPIILLSPLGEMPDGTHRMGYLAATPAAVAEVLGKPNVPDSGDGKDDFCYAYRSNYNGGCQIACWLYKNSTRGFSIWGDMALWEELFPGLIQPN